MGRIDHAAHASARGHRARKGGPTPGSSPTSTARSQPPFGKLTVPVAAGVLGLVCLVAYANSFSAELLLDNRAIILQDTRLRAVTWQNIVDIFSHGYWWPTSESDLFRPVTTLTYLLNYTLGGETPFGYHLVNLLLHWGNALLAFVLVRGCTRRAGIALITAAIVACHPLTVESVTNVIGRADLLAGLSLLGGVWLFRQALDADGLRRWQWLAGLALVYGVGVFSKESAVVLPAVMLLYILVYGNDAEARVPGRALRGWLQQATAFLAVVPGFVLLLYARWALFHQSPLYGQNGLDNPLALASAPVRVMTAVKVIGYYLGLCVWPARLSSDYSYNEITLFGGGLGGQDLHAWLALAVLIALAATALLAWRRQRHVTFFLGFAALTLLPTSNLLFPIGTGMAERFMYTPLIGVAAAGVLLLSQALTRVGLNAAGTSRQGALVATGLALVAVLAFTVRTSLRNEDWTSALRLWTSAAEASPDSYKVHQGLATSIWETDPSPNRLDEVIGLSTRALRIVESAPVPIYERPTDLYAKLGLYYLRKAEALSRSGQRDEERAVLGEALGVLRRGEAVDRALNQHARAAVAARSGDPRRVHDVGNVAIYRQLATAYVADGDLGQAEAAAEYMQHLAPQEFDAHQTRAVVEAALAQKEKAAGNEADAQRHLEAAAVNLVVALLLDPEQQQSWQTLARIEVYLAPPDPSPIQFGGTRPAFNPANPVVAGHIAQAASQLVRQLRASRQDDVAEAWRQHLSTAFHLGPDVFQAGAGSRQP